MGEQKLPYGKHSSHLKSRLLEAGQVLKEIIIKDRVLAQTTVKEVSPNRDSNQASEMEFLHRAQLHPEQT